MADRTGNVAQLRAKIDAGLTGDRSPANDPAAAPLGTDEEAAGSPPSPHAIVQAGRVETARKASTSTNSPSPATTPQGDSSSRPSASWYWIALVAAVLLAAAVWFAAF